MRVKFQKGKQREFLKNVLFKLNCPSLRAISQFGFDIPYSTMKNYFSEARTLPKNFFIDLCYISKINSETLNVKYLDENYGKVLGGKN